MKETFLSVKMPFFCVLSKSPCDIAHQQVCNQVLFPVFLSMVSCCYGGWRRKEGYLSATHTHTHQLKNPIQADSKNKTLNFYGRRRAITAKAGEKEEASVPTSKKTQASHKVCRAIAFQKKRSPLLQFQIQHSCQK